MIYQGYDDKFADMFARKLNEHCFACGGTGEIETDNNGPIVACPSCQPLERIHHD